MPPVPVPPGSTVTGDGVTVGSGPVEVDRYVDFQCPRCRQFRLHAGPTLTLLVAELLITLIDHPMNLLDAGWTTGFSTRAAAAAAAAAECGRYADYADALFVRVARDQPPDAGDVELVELGRALGIDAPEFAESIRGGKYLPWPGYVTECAAARGVTTVPRMFVHGLPIAPQLGPILTAVRDAVG